VLLQLKVEKSTNIHSSECKIYFCILFFLSLCLVSLGNPVFVPYLSYPAACIGYALFWLCLYFFGSTKKRFFVSGLWYFFVQLVQLSWMTATEYQGNYILFIYVGIALFLGVQFGFLTLLLPKEKEQASNMEISRICAVASCWTLIEWARLYVLCGFSLNTSGMALAVSPYSAQLASVFGLLALSFVVLFINAYALRWLIFKSSFYRNKSFFLWCALASMPYLFGGAHYFFQKKQVSNSATFQVCLVQTGLLPGEKSPLFGRAKEYISPWNQWKWILQSLKEHKNQDLIVLPETVVPFRMSDAIYSLEGVIKVFSEVLELDVKDFLPPLEWPYAEKKIFADKESWQVSNAFWAQTLCNVLQADLIAGLDEKDLEEKKNYNAAFYFRPMCTTIERYEKRVLVPLAEYLPTVWLKPFVSRYGISEFFTPGTEAKIFFGKVPFSVSICYEETFSDLIREGTRKGAQLLVNVTNDNWYPDSLLPLHHYEQGRLRAIENGTPLIRACNSGVTVAVDCLGETVARLQQKECKKGVLVAQLPLYQYKTFYMIWGDAGIVAISFLFLLFFWKRRNKACFK